MKMQLNAALILAGVLALSAQANAESEQSAETKTKVENVTPNVPVKKEGEADVDEVITNRKLRAETGAKSKYSFSTALSYNGGTVNDPGSAVRPNISSSKYVPLRAALSGSLGGKYKISALQSISADIGVKIYKPFHKDDKVSFRDRTTVADPSLTYQVVYQTAGIQNVSTIGGSVTTDSDPRDSVGQVGSVSIGQTAIYDFGGSIWSVGLAGDITYTAFDKDKNALNKDGEQIGMSQGDYSVALYPFAEVNISDKLNLRTVFRPWIFEHARAKNFGEIDRAPYTQSVGVGISVTRDLYLYPNLQFAPLNFAWDRTNVALAVNLNI